MKNLKLKLMSEQDKSVNFLFEGGQESRFVQRTDDYFICYLSSHNGCNKACRFCHLTQTKQTDFLEASVSEMLIQAKNVLDHYVQEVLAGRQKTARTVHFNWMARGEPLSSSVVTGQWGPLRQALIDLSLAAGVESVRFNISSIFPEDVPASRALKFFNSKNNPTLFYSLYSLDPAFRKRWLPKAQDPRDVLKHLADWQQRTGGEIVLHWAMIEGENDDEKTVSDIVRTVCDVGLSARFNLVRYNPYSQAQGQEPEEWVLHSRFNEMNKEMRVQGSRIVPRVGFDVKASCGMFLSASGQN